MQLWNNFQVSPDSSGFIRIILVFIYSVYSYSLCYRGKHSGQYLFLIHRNLHWRLLTALQILPINLFSLAQFPTMSSRGSKSPQTSLQRYLSKISLKKSPFWIFVTIMQVVTKSPSWFTVKRKGKKEERGRYENNNKNHIGLNNFYGFFPVILISIYFLPFGK